MHDGSSGAIERSAAGRRMSRHVYCWAEFIMAKLEARFHAPDRRSGPYIVVGHVTWPDSPASAAPSIKASPSLVLAPAPATLLATLRHLVRTNLRSLGSLESFENEYWSFVRI
jgi:hypothetical protein